LVRYQKGVFINFISMFYLNWG